MVYAAQIIGTGSAFPQKRMTNFDIIEKLASMGIESSEEWVRERTGIRERRISDPDNPVERNSSLGMRAAQEALEMAGKTPADIDLIIYATCSPDTKVPSTACRMQHKLGADRAWAMDINAACTGFLYALSIAEKFIFCGQVKTALVIGSEVLSPFINWEDRNTCFLFGDGAGAAILQQAPLDSDHRILASHLFSNGHLWELIHVPAGGSSTELTPERYAQKLGKIRMNGTEVFKIAVRTMADLATKALAEQNMTTGDLTAFIPHQANIRIIESVAGRLNLAAEKVVVNVDRFGNTSAATIPTALDEAVRDGRIRSGNAVLLDAFGAGLTSGSLLMRW